MHQRARLIPLHDLNGNKRQPPNNSQLPRRGAGLQQPITQLFHGTVVLPCRVLGALQDAVRGLLPRRVQDRSAEGAECHDRVSDAGLGEGRLQDDLLPEGEFVVPREFGRVDDVEVFEVGALVRSERVGRQERDGFGEKWERMT